MYFAKHYQIHSYILDFSLISYMSLVFLLVTSVCIRVCMCGRVCLYYVTLGTSSVCKDVFDILEFTD